MKNPTLTTVLNAVPGLGYIYLGGKKRIFGILLIIALLAIMITFFDPILYSEEQMKVNELWMNAGLRVWDLFYAVGILLPVAAFMYDGYVSANLHNASQNKNKK